jgi:hypothetical protein
MINFEAAKYDIYIGYNIMIQPLDLYLFTHVEQHIPYQVFHTVKFQIPFFYRPH